MDLGEEEDVPFQASDILKTLQEALNPNNGLGEEEDVPFQASDISKTLQEPLNPNNGFRGGV